MGIVSDADPQFDRQNASVYQVPSVRRSLLLAASERCVAFVVRVGIITQPAETGQRDRPPGVPTRHTPVRL
jgi:hypothetical protein